MKEETNSKVKAFIALCNCKIFIEQIKVYKIVFCILVFTTTSSFSKTQTRALSEELKTSWDFRRVGNTDWLPATVPGTVHTDLLNNKLIDDPFYGDNEKKLQWIDTCNWEYRTFFDCSSELFSCKHIEIQFDGLDTYAKVYLNDNLILVADNMFRTWRIDSKKFLKKKDNHLLIRFEPASEKGKKLALNLPYTLPGDEKVFTRKAAYHYGWDWGPRFITCGIWKKISLSSWDEAVIRNVQIVGDSLSDELAEMNAVVVLESDHDAIIKARCIPVGENIVLETPVYKVIKGVNTISIPFRIHHPKRWWSNGAGEAFLYHYVVDVGDQREMIGRQPVTFGLRTIELVQQNDSIGKSFYIRLNGVPVFMKGANYIPPDNFLPRVTKDRYKEIIQSAIDANMNMLRVWGGGIYEDDLFYNLCDEKGLLVWQDFMFACSMYPGDSAFTGNVKSEAIDNVIRLRNHPCIALWCGNNEIDEGWKNWEWQSQYKYSANDSAKIWHDYLKLFHEIIPKVISEYDSNASYWASSPSIGWGHSESLLRGDSHYWGVWWGMEPFEVYKKKIGRFMSEYGFQGMPSLNTFKKFCSEKEFSFSSESVKNHQKHPTGYATIQKYLERDYRQPSFNLTNGNYIYVSQLLQAEGIKTAIEAHRRAKPYCMGTLYWQLNDCWPVTSWSSTDYYGEWKALHYTVKKSYKEYLLSPVIENGRINVYVVSDNRNEINASLEIKLLGLNGNIYWSENMQVIIPAGSSRIFFRIDSSAALKNADPANVVLSVKLLNKDSLLSENLLYFSTVKELKLAQPDVSYSFKSNGKQILLELSSKILAKNVFIDFSDSKIKLSDNYFDLLPGEKKTVEIVSDMRLDELTKKIKLKTLYETY